MIPSPQGPPLLFDRRRVACPSPTSALSTCWSDVIREFSAVLDDLRSDDWPRLATLFCASVIALSATRSFSGEPFNPAISAELLERSEISARRLRYARIAFW